MTPTHFSSLDCFCSHALLYCAGALAIVVASTDPEPPTRHPVVRQNHPEPVVLCWRPDEQADWLSELDAARRAGITFHREGKAVYAQR